MAIDLFGYDMILQITQNEINSQFEYLMNEGYIESFLSTNAVSQSGGPFGSGTYDLSSYLRGSIEAPTVSLGYGGNPTQCLFQFTMQVQQLTEATMSAAGITQEQVEAAFASPQQGPNGSEYGLLVNEEDIPYSADGSPATLTNQTVYYWLQRTSVTIGTTTDYTYYLVPALFYVSDGEYPTLVDLSGLPIQFTVSLSMIPTTPSGLEALVNAGLMPSTVLDTLDGNDFNSSYFSLQQLFLDFDTTDFTAWSTTAPPASTMVSGASIDTANNTFSIATETLAELNEDETFLTEVSVALQYAFGTGDSSNPAATPYIVGISASSTNPADSDPQSPPLLVPTSVGFTTVADSSTPGLSVLTYQVMGGGQAPPSGSVTSSWVTSNDYSGELLFSEATFFTPEIFNPIVLALTSEHAPTPTWAQEGNTFGYSTSYSWIVSSTPPPSPWFSEGQTVTQFENPDYTMVVSGNTVTVSGTMSITQQLSATFEVLGIHIPLVWSVTCSSTFNQVMTLEVTNGSELKVALTTNTVSPPVNGPMVPNDWEAGLSQAVITIVSDLISFFFPLPTLQALLNPMSYMTGTMHKQIDTSLSGISGQLNSDLLAASSSNFMSPTGDVFLLNNPRFTDSLDLQMDVTYSD